MDKKGVCHQLSLSVSESNREESHSHVMKYVRQNSINANFFFFSPNGIIQHLSLKAEDSLAQLDI